MGHLQLGIIGSRPLGTHPTTWRATADETPRRLEQSWKVSTCDSQAPGAGRSSPTFWHETGWNGERGSYRLCRGYKGPCERQKGAIPLITWYSLQDSREPSASLRVLLAEDNLVNQRLATRLLEKRGHSVVVAGNGPTRGYFGA